MIGLFEKYLRIWDLASASFLKNVDANGDIMCRLAYLRSPKLLISLDFSSNVKVWARFPAFNLLRQFQCHGGVPYSITVDQSAGLLVHYQRKDCLQLYQVVTGRRLKKIVLRSPNAIEQVIPLNSQKRCIAVCQRGRVSLVNKFSGQEELAADTSDKKFHAACEY